MNARSERRTASSIVYTEMLGGAFLVAFGVASATRVGRFAVPGLPPVSAPFLLIPLGCLSVGAIRRASSHRRGSARGAVAWVLAVGLVLALANLALLTLPFVGVPAPDLPPYGVVAGGALVTVGSVSMGTLGLYEDGVAGGGAVLLVSWPFVAALSLGAFVLFDVGTVVAAATIPFGMAWLLLASPRALP